MAMKYSVGSVRIVKPFHRCRLYGLRESCGKTLKNFYTNDQNNSDPEDRNVIS